MGADPRRTLNVTRPASICGAVALGNGLFFSKLSSRGDARLMPADIALPNAMLRVIPRDQHNVSRKDISPNALRVLYRLREAGFSAYLVGGAVRDLLVG